MKGSHNSGGSRNPWRDACRLADGFPQDAREAEFLLLGPPGHGRSSLRDSIDACCWSGDGAPEPGVRPYHRCHLRVIERPFLEEQVQELFQQVPIQTVLVVSALEGPTDDVRKLLALVNYLGHPPPLVWLNKVDLAEPDEIALADMCLRDLFRELGWECSEIFAGSAGRAFRHISAAKAATLALLERLLEGAQRAESPKSQPSVVETREFRAVVAPCHPEGWRYWEKQGCPTVEVLTARRPWQNEALLVAWSAPRFPAPVMDAEICLSHRVALAALEPFWVRLMGETIATGRVARSPG